MEIFNAQTVGMLGAAIALAATIFQNLDLSGKKLEARRRNIEIHIRSIEQTTNELSALEIPDSDFEINGVSFNESIRLVAEASVAANKKNNELILETLRELDEADSKHERARGWIQLLGILGASVALAGYYFS